MNNQVTVIREQELLGRNFRMYGTVENPLFLAKDVAEWLDYSKVDGGSYNVSAMLSGIDEDEKLKITMMLAGRNRKVWFLTEEGLYEVLTRSHKPIAKQLKKQVKEILKEIRIIKV